MVRVALRDGWVDLEDGRLVQGGRRGCVGGVQLEMLASVVGASPHVASYERLVADVGPWVRTTRLACIHQAARRLRRGLGPAANQLQAVSGVGYRWISVGVGDRAVGDLSRLVGDEADRGAVGYRGVEHVLGALLRLPATTGPRVRMRRALAGWRPAELPGAQLTLHPLRATAITGDTPRLRRLWCDLRHDLDAALSSWLDPAIDPWFWQWLGRCPAGVGVGSGSLVGRPQPRREERPARSLEVLGGPEDGRRVRLLPGVLGRHSSSNGDDVIGLYERTRLTDPSLHRRHVTLGIGQITPVEPVRLVRSGVWSVVDANRCHAVLVGDVVALSDETRLRGVWSTDCASPSSTTT